MVSAPRPQAPLQHGNPDEHRRLIAARANAGLPKDGTEALTGPLGLQQVAFADLPAAADYTAHLLFITDEIGGAVPAYSDGTNWRRVTDGTIASDT